jgi:hypothetical protein
MAEYVDAGTAIPYQDLSMDVGSAPPVTKGVTYERILNARDEPHNWLTYYGAYNGQRYSPLDQINASNDKADRVDFIPHVVVVYESALAHASQQAGNGRFPRYGSDSLANCHFTSRLGTMPISFFSVPWRMRAQSPTRGVDLQPLPPSLCSQVLL